MGKIRVFSEAQIWMHKHLIHVVGLLIITGLPFMSRELFGWIAYVFGYPLNIAMGVDPYVAGMEVVRLLHRIAGVTLLVLSVAFLIIELPRIRKWQIFPEGSLGEAIRNMIAYYLGKRRVRFGKYNLGQKLWTWGVIFGIPLMIVTGLIMWFRDLYPAWMVETAHILHVIGASLAIIGLVIHVYAAIGIPEHRAMVEAMFRTGSVDEEYLKEHHPLYYEKIKSP